MQVLGIELRLKIIKSSRGKGGLAPSTESKVQNFLVSNDATKSAFSYRPFGYRKHAVTGLLLVR